MAASAADKKKYLDEMRGLLASYGAAGGETPAPGAESTSGDTGEGAETEGTDQDDFLARSKEITDKFRKVRKEILSHNLRALKSKETTDAMAEYEGLMAAWEKAGTDIEAREQTLEKFTALAERVRKLAEEEAGQDSEMQAIMEQDARIYEQANRLRPQIPDAKVLDDLWDRFVKGHNAIWAAQAEDDLKGAQEGLEALRDMLAEMEDQVRKAGGDVNPPENSVAEVDQESVEFHKRKTKLFAEAQQMVRKLPSANESGYPEKIQAVNEEFDKNGDVVKERERLLRKMELIIEEMRDIIAAAEEKQQAMDDALEEGRDLRDRINERLETVPDRDRMRMKKELNEAWGQFVAKGEKERDLDSTKGALLLLRRLWRELETMYPAGTAE
jgi:hypothetical protein